VSEVDQDARIVLERDVAQDLGELACGELARSASAADHFGQALLSEEAHGCLSKKRSAIVPKPRLACWRAQKGHGAAPVQLGV
jgi:hypothetical protein